MSSLNCLTHPYSLAKPTSRRKALFLGSTGHSLANPPDCLRANSISIRRVSTRKTYRLSTTLSASALTSLSFSTFPAIDTSWISEANPTARHSTAKDSTKAVNSAPERSSSTSKTKASTSTATNTSAAKATITTRLFLSLDICKTPDMKVNKHTTKADYAVAHPLSSKPETLYLSR